MHAPELQKTDMRPPAPHILMNDLLIACSLLTRLPLPNANWNNGDRPAARASWAYPLVGLLVGLIAVVTGALGEAMQLYHGVVAILMLFALCVTTGAMHEDGLADCADGFWGGWEKARRLEIMKDSAIGTYGVLALIAAFALKWASVSSLLANNAVPVWVIILPAIMSRAAMVAVMELLPNAKGDGLSSQTGRPGKPAMWVAIGFGICAAVLAPANAFLLTCVVSLFAGVVGLIALRKIGGQTGDVLGACQVVTEVSLLVALSAAIT